MITISITIISITVSRKLAIASELSSHVITHTYIIIAYNIIHIIITSRKPHAAVPIRVRIKIRIEIRVRIKIRIEIRVRTSCCGSN